MALPVKNFKLDTTNFGTLNGTNIGTMTVGQLKAVVDLLARVRCSDEESLATVATRLGSNQP